MSSNTSAAPRPPLRILETTLRDGSYTINFKFTAADTAVICRELEEIGFDLIELGHGIGLGATEHEKWRAAETDEAYLRAAAETLTRADWGMFCIPGIARLEHIDVAAEYGMDFIRIGTDIEDVEASAPFIDRAKRHGMFVCANFMKSYAAAPTEFAAKAKLTHSYGSDVLYVVDSAGGMISDEMEAYFRAVQDSCGIPLGFHGHNNLQLAVANSLRAVELGACLVDTSLHGMGRSAGNTPTEIFLLVLERRGIRLGINPLRVMDVGDKYIKPLLDRRGLDSLDVISGYAQFHSSYMGIIRDYSSKYRVDPRRLIIALCDEDRVNASREVVERIAERISVQSDEVFSARFHLDKYFGSEQVKDE